MLFFQYLTKFKNLKNLYFFPQCSRQETNTINSLELSIMWPRNIQVDFELFYTLQRIETDTFVESNRYTNSVTSPTKTISYSAYLFKKGNFSYKIQSSISKPNLRLPINNFGNIISGPNNGWSIIHGTNVKIKKFKK